MAEDKFPGWHGTTILAVRKNGRPVDLTAREFDLVELFIKNPGRVYSRAQLFEQLYSADSLASDKVIEVLVSTLRAKLARGGLEELIQTRRGFGYAAR